MPSFTTAIEDTSPLLIYSANWIPGSSSDNQADQYTQSSFTLTQTNGATMAFSFYGTSVAVYGARRSNHGSYNAKVDQSESLSLNGQSNTNQFNQTLFTSKLNLGLHNLSITNGGDTFFDVDYVTFESSVGNDDEDLIVNTYQNAHPAFAYTPSSAWNPPNNVGTFVGGSGHATTQAGTTATFTFQGNLAAKSNAIVGDAIALYGPVGPNSSSLYSVQVDSQVQSFFSANKGFYRPQQVLYFAGNLGSGKHTLQIQPVGQSGGELAIDYATVYTTPSLGGSFLETGPTAQNVNNRVPPGAVAGLVFTSVLAIFACIFSGFLFWRQRHTLSRSYKHKLPKPVVGVQGPEFAQPFFMYPTYQQSAPRSTRTSVHSRASSQYSSNALTSLTVPITMTMSSAPTHSVARTNSEFNATTISRSPPSEVPSSTGMDYSAASASLNAQACQFPSEKALIVMRNPTSSFQHNYDEPNAAGSYLGLQLPVHEPVSPLTAPPEYSQRPLTMKMAEPGRMHVINNE